MVYRSGSSLSELEGMGCLLCLRKYRIQNDETLESIGRVRHQLGLTEITPDNQLPDSNRVINVVGLLSRY
jgi:hypothetical protein